MSARDIVGGLADKAVSAVKHTVTTAEKVAEAAVGKATGHVKDVSDDVDAASRTVAEKAEKVTPSHDTTSSASASTSDKGAGAKDSGNGSGQAEGQSAVDEADLPDWPEEEPIRIVEQVLEDEANEEPGSGAGRATEPRAASRDEEHGEAHLQRAEEDEIAEEATEALSPAAAVGVETPVGTTGADAGFNPDTAEAGLQQPDTPPLMDPGTVHAIESEAETLQKDADVRKD